MFWKKKGDAMQPLIRMFVGVAVRHTLTGLGLVGLVSADDTNQLIGAVSIIVGIALSLVEKKLREKAA